MRRRKKHLKEKLITSVFSIYFWYEIQINDELPVPSNEIDWDFQGFTFHAT